ncbi:MAG: hypothetical protein ACLQBY_10420 [Solirubrobacteraceae bacterium]
MIAIQSDGVPPSGLDVIEGVLGGEPRPGDVLRLNDRQHERVVRELRHTFNFWRAPDLVQGQYRAMLDLPDQFDDPAPITFSGAAIFAHQVVLRDPLDLWLREFDESGTERRSVSLAALDAAARQALPLRRLLDAGILVLVPAPRSVWEDDPLTEFLAAREVGDLESSQSSSFPEVDLEARALFRDPRFATAVLGQPVGRDWMVALGDADDEQEELDWQMRGEPGPSDQEHGEVYVAALQFARRSQYALAANASLLPTNRLENALVDTTLETVGEMTSVTTSKLLHCTGVGQLCDLHPADVLAIREAEEAYHKWREWLEKVCTTSSLAEVKGLGGAQGLFDAEVIEETAAALKDATRAASLQRYVRGEGAVTASHIAIEGLLGLPPAGEVGGAALKIAQAVFRPRADGHRAILVRLAERP